MQSLLGIVTHNVTPLRATPDGDSEQVSQAILGDVIALLEERDGWVCVRTSESYEGWIRCRHACPLAVQDPSVPFWPFDEAPERACRVISGFASLYEVPEDHTSLITKLVFGTWVRKIGVAETDRGLYFQVAAPLDHLKAGLTSGYVDAYDLQTADAWRTDHAGFDGQRACALAKRFVGTPYLWGGTTPFGFDCSGLVQRIYLMLGVMLPRDANIQASSPLGVRLSEEEGLCAGDLVFFAAANDPCKRGITHVGMALDALCYIHATGDAGVAVTAFDDPHYRAKYTYCGAWRFNNGGR